MSRQKTIVWIISSILIMVCFISSIFINERMKGKVYYDAVVFGDSIVAGTHSESEISDQVGFLSNLNIFNAGFGGITMSVSDTQNYVANKNQFFTMVSLSKGVRDKDFSHIYAASKNEDGYRPEYWEGTAYNLSKVDISKLKYVFIEYGVNDYQLGIKLESDVDPYAVNTFAGALRTSIENIQKGAKDAKIILITPIFTHLSGEEANCNSRDYGGGLLADYVNCEKRIAREYNLYVIDNFNEVSINEENYTDYLVDGLHPNDEGKKLISENIARHINSIKDK